MRCQVLGLPVSWEGAGQQTAQLQSGPEDSVLSCKGSA